MKMTRFENGLVMGYADCKYYAEGGTRVQKYLAICQEFLYQDSILRKDYSLEENNIPAEFIFRTKSVE